MAQVLSAQDEWQSDLLREKLGDDARITHARGVSSNAVEDDLEDLMALPLTQLRKQRSAADVLSMSVSKSDSHLMDQNEHFNWETLQVAPAPAAAASPVLVVRGPAASTSPTSRYPPSPPSSSIPRRQQASTPSPKQPRSPPIAHKPKPNPKAAPPTPSAPASSTRPTARPRSKSTSAVNQRRPSVRARSQPRPSTGKVSTAADDDHPIPPPWLDDPVPPLYRLEDGSISLNGTGPENQILPAVARKIYRDQFAKEQIERGGLVTSWDRDGSPRRVVVDHDYDRGRVSGSQMVEDEVEKRRTAEPEVTQVMGTNEGEPSTRSPEQVNVSHEEQQKDEDTGAGCCRSCVMS